MRNKYLTGFIFVLIVVVIFVSLDLMAKKYKKEIMFLEKENFLKDERILELEDRLKVPAKPVSLKDIIQIQGVTPLDLQKALKRNGFYSGPMDGRLNQRIVDAVKKFQKENHLKSDGVVGKRTWILLRGVE